MWLLLLSTAVCVTADASIGKMPVEQSVAATLGEVTELLGNDKADDSSILSSTVVDDMNQKMVELANSIRHLESLTEQLSEKESKINSILHTVNTRQMESLVERLELTLGRETMLRELEVGTRQKQQELVQHDRSEKSLSNDQSVTVDDKVTSKNLIERLDTSVIMGKSEEEMETWIFTLIEEEVGRYKKGIFDLASQVDTRDRRSDTETAECPSLITILQNVQQALNDHAEDGIGMVDHAQGASVVHWLTSKTYSPFTDRSRTLGSVWWNKFIPQDWERLLPSGWEQLEVGIPSFVYHSLVSGLTVHTISHKSLLAVCSFYVAVLEPFC